MPSFSLLSWGLASRKYVLRHPLKRGIKGFVLEYRINVQIQILLIINSLDSKRFGRHCLNLIIDYLMFIAIVN